MVHDDEPFGPPSGVCRVSSFSEQNKSLPLASLDCRADPHPLSPSFSCSFFQRICPQHIGFSAYLSQSWTRRTICNAAEVPPTSIRERGSYIIDRSSRLRLYARIWLQHQRHELPLRLSPTGTRLAFPYPSSSHDIAALARNLHRQTSGKTDRLSRRERLPSVYGDAPGLRLPDSLPDIPASQGHVSRISFLPFLLWSEY